MLFMLKVIDEIEYFLYSKIFKTKANDSYMSKKERKQVLDKLIKEAEEVDREFERRFLGCRVFNERK